MNTMPRHGHDWNGRVRRRRLQTLGCPCVALLHRAARRDNLADEWQPPDGNLPRRGSAARTRARRACALLAAPACSLDADGCWRALRDTSRAAQQPPRAYTYAARVMTRWTRTETHVQRSSSPVPFRSRRRSECSASESAPFLAQRAQRGVFLPSRPCEGSCNTPKTCAARR